MNQDPIFRGLMRPATVLGIPMVPFMLVQGSLLLCLFFFSVHFLWLILIAHFVMRLMMKKDELIFDLIGLRLIVWAQCRNALRPRRSQLVLTALR